MGGWGILDYAVNFAPEPYDWIQLGYASYLSSWSLMNTGPKETNYGFWFPGPENDGASGWQFMTAKFGRAWIRKDMPRGPWNYDGEIDLGYGAALRIATTILSDDPLFGWFVYGGTLDATGKQLSIVPRDGLRQRFYAVLPDARLKIELDRDGFAQGLPLVTDKSLSRLRWTLENRTGDFHSATLTVDIAGKSSYALYQEGKKVGDARGGTVSNIDLKISKAATALELVKLSN